MDAVLICAGQGRSVRVSEACKGHKQSAAIVIRGLLLIFFFFNLVPTV